MAKKSNTIIEILNGRILNSRGFKSRMPVIIVVAILVLFYMTLSFQIQQKYGYIQTLKNQISELHTTSATTSSERQKRTRLSNIERLIEQHNIPLVRTDKLPHIIETKK